MVGLPHTQTVVEHMTVCAFTQKLVKFCEMMGALGHEIFVYSGEHNDAVCAEHIPVFTDEQQRQWYGDHDPNLLPTIATWNRNDPQWTQMNARTVSEISQRIEPGDLILLLAGLAQQPIADAFPNHTSAEWAVGYEGFFSPFCCFESYAWMHYLYGRYLGAPSGGAGRWYDVVIPNFFRPEDFEPTADHDDYLLFVGRITERKGPHVAAELAKAAGRKLLVAGSGVAYSEPGLIQASEGFQIEGDVEYVGVADVKTRNRLMARAHAIVVPTTYIEPFGAVNVEAQLCGTPAITTDWGAFTETVEHGVTGFRFRTLAEGVDAVERCGDLDRDMIRQRALDRYSLEAIAPLYDDWLQRLANLSRGGWYEGTILCPRPGEVTQYVVPEDAPHLGGYIKGGDWATYYPDLWRWLVEVEGVRSMMDVGCGDGHAIKFFRDLGCEVIGIDGVAQDDPDIYQWDFTDGPLPMLDDDRVDLVWCCEFVEHVEGEYEGNYLPLLTRGKLLLLTHAVPGQGGWHHVHEQESSYWIDRLRVYGMEFDLDLTRNLRRMVDTPQHFFRTGLAFRPKPSAYSNRDGLRPALNGD
jgi:glycosyltransferase involved in cell wall biosynthesis